MLLITQGPPSTGAGGGCQLDTSRERGKEIEKDFFT
jgi:hypothetical protein